MQDQTNLTYQSLLGHCKQLKARCEQFQQAQAKVRAHLTAITSASSSDSSIHANLQTTVKQPCSRCRYAHPCGSCPVYNHRCYNYHRTGYFTALCKRLQNTNVQLTHLTSAESPEGGPKDLPTEEDQVGHPAEEDTHIKVPPMVQATQDIQVQVAAHHRTTTREGHHIEGDTVPHHTGIRSAT